MYDPDAIRKQQEQHQAVIDSLLKQRASLDESIAQIQGEIDKLEDVLKLMSSTEG